MRAKPWLRRDVRVVLPTTTAEGMFKRAEQWDIEKGGRFDKRSGVILLWSGNAMAAEQGEPVGAFHVHWHDPDQEHATVYKIEWGAAIQDGEADVWRALDLLAGRPIARG